MIKITKLLRGAEIVNVPFMAALTGCSARRSERSMAGHTSEEQQRNTPVSAFINGTLAVSASLTQSEGKTLDFKRDRSSPKTLLKSLVAITNTAGGRLIVGMADDCQVLGVANALDELVSGALKKQITHLLTHEFIEMSLPATPNSRLQRYRLTNLGRGQVGKR